MAEVLSDGNGPPAVYAVVTIKLKQPGHADREERIRFARTTTEHKLQGLIKSTFGLPSNSVLTLKDGSGCFMTIDENLPDGEDLILEVADKTHGRSCKICGYDEGCFKVKHTETVEFYKEDCPDLQLGDMFCRSCYMKWYQKSNPLKRKAAAAAAAAATVVDAVTGQEYADLMNSPKQGIINTDSPVVQKLLNNMNVGAMNVSDVPLSLLNLVHSAGASSDGLMIDVTSPQAKEILTPSRKKRKDEKKICSICGCEVPGKCYRMKDSMIDYYVNHLKIVETAHVDAILCDPCYRKWQRHRQKEGKKSSDMMERPEGEEETQITHQSTDEEESEKRQAELDKLRQVPKWTLQEFEELRGKRKLRVAAMLTQLDIRKKLEGRKHENWAKYLDRCTKEELEKRLQGLLEQESRPIGEEEQIAFGQIAMQPLPAMVGVPLPAHLPTTHVKYEPAGEQSHVKYEQHEQVPM
jgi:hypothetical protein